MAKTTRKNQSFNSKLVVVFLAVMIVVMLFFLVQKINLVKQDSEILHQQNIALGILNDEKITLTTEKERYEKIQTDLDQVKIQYFIDTQKLEQMIINKETTAKIAYLTFDDGPYLLTTKFLDVLDEYDVLATFFTLGKSLELYESTYWRIIDSGHTLANHTYSHDLSKNGIYSSETKFINDLLKHQDFTKTNFNITTNVMRFPGGSAMTKRFSSTFKDKIKELGYGYIDWNISCGDGSSPVMPYEVYRDNVLNSVYDKKIICVLMHDYSYNTLLALPEIITGLEAKGYTFLPLFYESTMIKK